MQIDSSFLQVVLICTAIVVGIMEWAKHGIKAAPSWVWWASLPPLAFAAAFVAGGGWSAIGIRTGLVWACGQLGYDLIVKGIIGLIKAGIEKIIGKPADTPAGTG